MIWDFSAHELLEQLQSENVDTAPFGIIEFDGDCLVTRYNKTEATAAGLAPDRVLGRHLFEVIAPCMNNFLVAQRFEDAAASGEHLDMVIDYVLTLKMKPTPVRLRLLASPALSRRYVLVERQSA